MNKELKMLTGGAIALVANATVVISGIAILNQYKATNMIDNDTADAFITGLGIFGSFIGLLVLVMMGSVIYGMVRQQMKG